jgi:hypothetical protein
VLGGKTGAVWMLDQEDQFRTRQFVNSSVPLLADCLLAWMDETDPSRLRAAIKRLVCCRSCLCVCVCRGLQCNESNVHPCNDWQFVTRL